MTIKVFIADDHAIVREGIRTFLQQQEDIEVIGQADNGLKTVEEVKKLQPDIVIMDISMPDLNGTEATRQITKSLPDVKVIALSMHSSRRYISEIFKAGAYGYLLKEKGFDELANAIRTVMEGEKYICSSLVDTVIDNYIKADHSEDSNIYSNLTTRQREILKLMAEGNTTKKIALDLHISPKTVEAHRLNIMKKLKFDNIAQLTKYAIQEGLTSPEPDVKHS